MERKAVGKIARLQQFAQYNLRGIASARHMRPGFSSRVDSSALLDIQRCTVGRFQCGRTSRLAQHMANRRIRCPRPLVHCFLHPAENPWFCDYVHKRQPGVFGQLGCRRAVPFRDCLSSLRNRLVLFRCRLQLFNAGPMHTSFLGNPSHHAALPSNRPRCSIGYRPAFLLPSPRNQFSDSIVLAAILPWMPRLQPQRLLRALLKCKKKRRRWH